MCPLTARSAALGWGPSGKPFEGCIHIGLGGLGTPHLLINRCRSRRSTSSNSFSFSACSSGTTSRSMR